jgi:hypothetical protein
MCSSLVAISLNFSIGCREFSKIHGVNQLGQSTRMSMKAPFRAVLDWLTQGLIRVPRVCMGPSLRLVPDSFCIIIVGDVVERLL